MQDTQPFEIRMLGELARGADTVTEVAAALGVPTTEVEDAVRWATDEDLALAVRLPDDVHLSLTPRGQYVVGVQQQSAELMDANGRIDLARVTFGLGRAWAAAQQGQREQYERAAADELVGAADRDAAVEALARAYSEGRFDLAELERRNQGALSATTRGELAAALDDVGPAYAGRVGPWPGLPPEMTRPVWMPGGKRILVYCVVGFVLYAVLISCLNGMSGSGA